MNFIKKVLNKEIDESVHLQFQKFSKGEFRNRALIKAKKVKDKCTITASAEFANDLVRKMAEKLGEGKTPVKGVIVYTGELDGIEYGSKKQFMGIKQYVIDSEISGLGIIDMMDKFPKAFFGLSFKFGENELKIKAKAPKSAKPGTKGDEKPSPDFCKLITKDESLVKDFIFEKSDFKLAEVNHTFIIEKIVVPEELKEEKDFSKVRELAKRKGKIIREAEIDGEKSRKEIEFEA